MTTFCCRPGCAPNKSPLPDPTSPTRPARPDQPGPTNPARPTRPAARFDFTEELGAARLYHFLYEDLPITVQSDQKHRFAAMQVVTLAIPPIAVHLFDAKTTRSLTAVAALAAKATRAKIPA